MDNELFIAEKIKVGYQQRADTYTSKLAYVIYYDAKGKLRKEKSWEGWRDKSIEPQEFDNVPTTGFMINKGIQRGGYDWYSDTVTKVRIWDPRDFEFEITLANLIAILMHSDVSKRDISVPCVYAWSGSDLVLLPANTEEYEASAKHTAKQSLKFSTKELKVGATYNVKRDNDQVVYLGYHPHYHPVSTADGKKIKYGSRPYASFSHELQGKKHVFYNLTDNGFEYSAPSALIASVAELEVHPMFPELLDTYYHQYQSQPIKNIVLSSDEHPNQHSYYRRCLVEISEHKFASLSLTFNVTQPYNHYQNKYDDYVLKIETNVDKLYLYDSETGKTTVFYTSHANRYDARHNDGSMPFDSHDQDVTKVIEPIFKRYSQLVQEAFDRWKAEVKATNQYHYLNNSVVNAAIFDQIAQEFHCAQQLNVVLADGKICANMSIG